MFVDLLTLTGVVLSLAVLAAAYAVHLRCKKRCPGGHA